IELIRSGRIRPLAVTTAARSDLIPDVPALGELLPGFEASWLSGIGAPKNTPAAIVDKLNREINACLADPAIVQRLAQLGGVPLRLNPAEYGKLIADEIEKWGQVIRVASIRPD